MSTASLEKMIGTVFTAPARAVVEAEEQYRKIWAEWLATTLSRIKATHPTTLLPESPDKDKAQAEILNKHLMLAPVMKLNGRIELGLTMRVASVSGFDAKLTLGAGPVSVSGGYFRQATEESVLSIRAGFTMTNTEVNLAGYLAENSIPLATATDVENAVKFLKGEKEQG
jgi:hypothetical protein